MVRIRVRRAKVRGTVTESPPPRGRGTEPTRRWRVVREGQSEVWDLRVHERQANSGEDRGGGGR